MEGLATVPALASRKQHTMWRRLLRGIYRPAGRYGCRRASGSTTTVTSSCYAGAFRASSEASDRPLPDGLEDPSDAAGDQRQSVELRDRFTFGISGRHCAIRQDLF